MNNDTNVRFYRKTALQPMRPYVPGEDMSKILVNAEDTPALGGMVAHNPANPDDQWYVAEKFFKDNYEEALPMAQTPSVGRSVHYVAFGTSGGEYPAGICRHAEITEVHSPTEIGLHIVNPTGTFFNQHVHQDQVDKKPGTWHWPERV